MPPYHALIALLLASFFASLPAQEVVQRSYPVGALVAPPPGAVGQLLEEKRGMVLPPEWVLPSRSDLTWGLTRIDHPTQALFPEQLLGQLEDLGATRSSMVLQDGVLHLYADEGVHEQVRQRLRHLEAIMSRRYRVELGTLPASARGGLPAVLSDGQLVEAQAREGYRTVAVGEVLADVPVLWSQGRFVRYIRDYAVEVAQRAQLADPIGDAFFSGDRLGLSLTPMADGRLLVRLASSASREIGLDSRPLLGKNLGVVELPRVAVRSQRAEGLIAPGGGLLLATGGEACVLVRVQPLGPVGAAEGALMLGHLLVPPLRPLDGFLPGKVGDMSLGFRYGYESPSRPGLELLLGVVDEGLAGTIRVGTQMLGLPADRLEMMRPRVEALAATQRQAQLRWVLGSAAHEDLRGESASALAAAMPHRGQTVVMPGRTFAARAGLESAYVRDFDVEIAQRAQASNPVVERSFSGWSLWGAGLASGGDAVHLSCRLQWSAFDPRRADTANPLLGRLDAPRESSVDIEHRVRLEPGRWKLVHQGVDPERPDSHSLVLLLRVD